MAVPADGPRGDTAERDTLQSLLLVRVIRNFDDAPAADDLPRPIAKGAPHDGTHGLTRSVCANRRRRARRAIMFRPSTKAENAIAAYI